MKINKKEFEVLYSITLGKTDLDRGYDSNTKIKDIVLKLEKLGLIKVEYRDEKIYGFMLTQSGKEVLIDPAYEKWVEEFD